MHIEGKNCYSYAPVSQPEQSALQQEQTGPPQPSPSAAMPAKAPSLQDAFTITAQDQPNPKEEYLQKQRDGQQQIEELNRQLEASNKQTKKARDLAKIQAKCKLIAMRIMSGDTVPWQDYRYLAKNDPELYGKAIIMRIEKEDPKKHKRVSEEEEDKKSMNPDVSGASDTAATGISSVENSAIQISAAQLDIKV